MSSAPREGSETAALVNAAIALASTLGIKKLLVLADEVQDVRLLERLAADEITIVWLSRGAQDTIVGERNKDLLIPIPDTALSRNAQMTLGLLLACLNDQVHLDESIVCLLGSVGSRRLDTLFIANPRRDFPWFQKPDITGGGNSNFTQEFVRLIDIALQFASEGREGRPIGTTFVLGDPDKMAPFLRQMILNPCEGHNRKDRSIHNPEFVETLRELAALDGAFVVSTKGVVESAGTYLDAQSKKVKLRPGLGARHTSAAAFTAETSAIAVVISSSSGTVTVFDDGRAILELERSLPPTGSKRPKGKS